MHHLLINIIPGRAIEQLSHPLERSTVFQYRASQSTILLNLPILSNAFKEQGKLSGAVKQDAQPRNAKPPPEKFLANPLQTAGSLQIHCF